MRRAEVTVARPLLAIGLGALVATAATAAEPAPSDPWTLVPAFPTGCYQKDGFADKVAVARETVSQASARQTRINQELTEKVKTINPMEMASRQQQYMMDHPQEAMKLMQRNQALGEQFSDVMVQGQEEQKRLEQELEGLQTRYNAALDKELDPIRAKFKDLDVRAQKDLVPIGEIGYDYAPWAVAEWNVLNKQEQAAYERVCAQWWAASGPFHEWMKRSRERYVRQIPISEEADSVGVGFMVWIVGTPTASYKSTAKLEAIRQYLGDADRVFAKRRPAPNEPYKGHL